VIESASALSDTLAIIVKNIVKKAIPTFAIKEFSFMDNTLEAMLHTCKLIKIGSSIFLKE